MTSKLQRRLTLELVITGKMGASWKFIDSFPGLHRFPFQNLSTSDACFVYTTARHPASIWPVPSSGSQTQASDCYLTPPLGDFLI